MRYVTPVRLFFFLAIITFFIAQLTTVLSPDAVRINGKTETRTRTVIKTEWRSLAGQYVSYVFDVLVTASRGIANTELEALEPYALGTLRRYAPELISGWIAEDATLVGQEALGLARQETVAAVGKKLSEFMPGDSHMALAHQTWVENESLDLVLVPLWVIALRYDPKEPPVRVLVNGQTGKVAGKAPLSWIRISLAILLALIVIAGLVFAFAGGRR